MSNQETTLTVETLLAQAGWLRRLAGSLIGDPATAEDAVQDTLVTAWQRPPADPRNARAWFGTVLTNRVRREVRRRNTHARAVTQATTLESVTADGRAPRTPEQVFTSIELQRSIADLLLGLGVAYREVIFLRYFEDLNASEIGARLGVPAGTVRWRLKEGLDELRRRLDADDGAHGRDWRRALVPLAAIPDRAPGTPAPAAGAAGLGARPLLLAAAACAVLAVAGGATALRYRSPQGPASGAGAAGAVGSATAAPTPPGPGPTGAPAPAGPPALLAAAVVADASGAPELSPPRAPRRSTPYSGLRWDGDRPIARVNDEWVELLAIDGVPVADIVAFSKEEYGNHRKPDEWRRRIREDVVSLLLGLGHTVGPQARLEVKRAGRAPEVIVAAVTAENRARASDSETVTSAPPSSAPGPSSLVDDWARIAPFSDARFDGETVYVEVGDRWYRLLAMNGVSTERLVAVAKPFRRDWQKIVAEDTVELLTAATGRTPGATVDLDLEPFGSKRRVKLEKVPMTEENLKKMRLTWR